MFIKPRILLVSAVSILTLIACSSSNSPQGGAPAKDTVAATVNGTPIGERLVGLMLKQRTSLGRPADAEARSAFIDRLAIQVLISTEAVKKGLDKVPEVSDQLELGRQSVLVNAFVEDFLKNNTVSDDALKAEYEKVKSQTGGTEYKARHILVQKESEAKEVIARLKKNPKGFEALAKEKSKDHMSSVNGGDLGWFDPRGTVPEFGAALAQLAKGKMTDEPVKSQFGYHIILLEDSRQKPVQPLEQMKASLTQQLQQQNLRKLIDDMKAKAKIEIAQEPASAPAPAPAKETKAAEPAKK